MLTALSERLAPLRVWLDSVGAVIWARRWKIATLIVLAAVARSCEYLPEVLQPACELVVKLARAVPV